MTAAERYAHIQLALTPYIGAESFAELIAHYGSAQNALNAPANLIAQLGRHGKQAAKEWHNTDKARAATDAALEWEQQTGCRLLLSCDDDYPVMLREGITAPPVLFARGRTELLAQKAVGIVGSRHATPQALRIAHDFGNALSEHNITVISGMAAGIDTHAHQGALPHSGCTIAVWGTGIDRIYPQSNQKLAYQIAEQGLILSEFPLGTRPLAGNFPRRNRIIAAQSHAVLVVEAALESGSLITARQAAEMGREVMAVPGSIDNPHSKGCHKLIKEGAKLVEYLDDILSECLGLQSETLPIKVLGSLKNPAKTREKIGNRQPEIEVQSDNIVKQNDFITPEKTSFRQPENPVSTNLSGSQTENNTPTDQLLNQMGYDPIHPDQLAECLAWHASEVYATLTELELDGKISAMAGGRYQRIK